MKRRWNTFYFFYRKIRCDHTSSKHGTCRTLYLRCKWRKMSANAPTLFDVASHCAAINFAFNYSSHAVSIQADYLPAFRIPSVCSVTLLLTQFIFLIWQDRRMNTTAVCQPMVTVAARREHDKGWSYVGTAFVVLHLVCLMTTTPGFDPHWFQLSFKCYTRSHRYIREKIEFQERLAASWGKRKMLMCLWHLLLYLGFGPLFSRRHWISQSFVLHECLRILFDFLLMPAWWLRRAIADRAAQ